MGSRPVLDGGMGRERLKMHHRSKGGQWRFKRVFRQHVVALGVALLVKVLELDDQSPKLLLSLGTQPVAEGEVERRHRMARKKRPRRTQGQHILLHQTAYKQQQQIRDRC